MFAPALSYLEEPEGPVAVAALDGGLAKALVLRAQSACLFHVGDSRIYRLRHAAAARRRDAQELLGAARIEIAKRANLIDESAWSFCWVVDAPMFEPETDDAGKQTGWTAVHHPFTSPNAEWIDRFEEAPEQALAYAYDIVCNGNEIGGGSIRIHRAGVQRRVFEVLGISEYEANEKFGFLLEAFKYGPPPHGGIAFGWDRICMLLAGADSIREVIAFPKTRGGLDPLTGAPTPITAQQRREAGVDRKPA